MSQDDSVKKNREYTEYTFDDEELYNRFESIYADINSIKIKVGKVESDIEVIKTNHEDYLRFKRAALEGLGELHKRISPLEKQAMIETAIWDRKKSDAATIGKFVAAIGTLTAIIAAVWVWLS